MGELICRSCGNTGINLFKKPCSCANGINKQKEYILRFGFSEDEAPKVFEFAKKYNYNLEEAVRIIINVKNSF